MSILRMANYGVDYFSSLTGAMCPGKARGREGKARGRHGMARQGKARGRQGMAWQGRAREGEGESSYRLWRCVKYFVTFFFFSNGCYVPKTIFLYVLVAFFDVITGYYSEDPV